MGKGKGSHDKWVCPIKKGQIICEVICDFINKYKIVYKALKIAGSKLPVKTVISLNYY